MGNWFRRFVCRHSAVTLKATGPALVSPRGAEFSVVMAGVQVMCARCGEFWHAELDASEAMKAGLGSS